MKRPGGFDREPEVVPEPVVDERPKQARRLPSRVPRRPVAAAPTESEGRPTEEPDVSSQVTEVIADEDLPFGSDSDLTGRSEPDGVATTGNAADSAAEVIRSTDTLKGSVARALTWVGVGAPKDPVRAADRRVRAAARSRRRRERRERRRFAVESRRQRRGWLMWGGAVLALVVFIAVCAFTPLTAVQEVRVEGAQAVPEDDLARALSRFEGVPLAQVDDAEVHRALEVFPLIQRYRVERIPPHTLVVQVEERVPVISVEKNGTFNQFDAAGVKVGSADAAVPGVPVASGATSDLTSPAFAAAAHVMRDMPEALRAQVAAVSGTSAQDVTLTLASGLKVMWGGDSNTQRKSVVLQAMLTALADRALEHLDVSSPDAPVFR